MSWLSKTLGLDKANQYSKDIKNIGSFIEAAAEKVTADLGEHPLVQELEHLGQLIVTAALTPSPDPFRQVRFAADRIAEEQGLDWKR